mgnify:CR=1 FL=1
MIDYQKILNQNMISVLKDILKKISKEGLSNNNHLYVTFITNHKKVKIPEWLKKKYPQYQFTLLLGQDNIMHFDRWKAYRQILEQFQLYVYPRTQSDKIPASLLNHSNIVYFEASLLNVSATEIRNALKNKKLLGDLLPEKIQDYLRKFNLYL